MELKLIFVSFLERLDKLTLCKIIICTLFFSLLKVLFKTKPLNSISLWLSLVEFTQLDSVLFITPVFNTYTQTFSAKCFTLICSKYLVGQMGLPAYFANCM